MPRGRCKRYVSGEGEVSQFLPKGRRLMELAQVRLMPDELEALRLADLLGLYQEEAAARMQVSRPTFSRIVTAAHAKVADALVNGKAILVVPLAHAPDVLEDTMSYSEALDTTTKGTTATSLAGRRICIPIAVNHGLESKLLNHFGSAPLFAVVDVDARTMEIIDNSGTHGHGGCAPVDLLASRRVQAVIVGGIGTGAIRRLAAFGIPVFKGRPGPISALVDDYVKGLLAPWDIADGCAGQGHDHGHSHEHGQGTGHGTGRGRD